jgi:hypothetical protein
MASIDHSVAVGGDVLAHCTRCENAPNSSVTEPLWHTVVAKVGPLIVRVRCNTCKNEHAVRGETRAHKEPRGAKPPAPQVVRVQNRVPPKPWKELMYERDTSTAITYSVKAKVEKNDLVKHPTFGIGVVTELDGDRTKATVVFESGEKVLAVGRE